MKKCVYAGTFNPPTNGHIWLIKEGFKLFDEVHVVIAQNPLKNENGDDFVGVLKRYATDVHVIPQDEFTVDFCKKIGATHIIRGIRDTEDFVYEENLRNINKSLSKDIETVFFITPKELKECSSSLVRSMLKMKDGLAFVKNLVPEEVFDILREKNQSQPIKHKSTASGFIGLHHINACQLVSKVL